MPDKILLNNLSFGIVLEPFDKQIFDDLKQSKTDVVLMSFNSFPEIDLESEIDGTGDCLAGLVGASLESSTTVFCGVTTQILGVKHISVVVCHHGRLVDIVDRTSDLFSDGYEPTDKIKIYSADTMRIAVLVDKDIMLQKNWEKIEEHCDLIVGIIKGSDELVLDAAVRASMTSAHPVIILSDAEVHWRE